MGEPQDIHKIRLTVGSSTRLEQEIKATSYTHLENKSWSINGYSRAVDRVFTAAFLLPPIFYFRSRSDRRSRSRFRSLSREFDFDRLNYICSSFAFPKNNSRSALSILAPLSVTIPIPFSLAIPIAVSISWLLPVTISSILFIVTMTRAWSRSCPRSFSFWRTFWWYLFAWWISS